MLDTKIAILGLGLIGAAGAALFLSPGARVRAWDPEAAPRGGLADCVATPLHQLAQITGHPAPLIIAHPVNPPHLVPLVETQGSDPARLDRTGALHRAADRHPVRRTEPATGQIANRPASAPGRAAGHLVADGGADVPAVDGALDHGPGLRGSAAGAHMACHVGRGPGSMAGDLDHPGPSQKRRRADPGTPSPTPEIPAALEHTRNAALTARTTTGHL